MTGSAQPILSVRHVANAFGSNQVHRDVNFDVAAGEIIGIVGGSGSGKSVLLRTMTGLHTPNSGEVLLGGRKVARLSPRDIAATFGVLFQQGALFSSLTVEQNITLAMREHTNLSPAWQARLAALKLALVELEPQVAQQYPSELSGGMVKRAALARALALDPAVLFLDEPTAGLDPLTADAFDQLIKTLNTNLGVTVVMVTHDLDSLFALCHRIAVLVDGRVIIDTPSALLEHEHPWIHEYFHGPRARAALKG